MSSAERQSGGQSVSIEQALELAVQHHGAGRLADAEQIYQRILNAIPDQPMAMHLLGVLSHQLGKTDDAIELVTNAVAIAPDYAEAHGNLANMFQAQGRWEEAVASYRTALALDPGSPEAHANLGNALKELGRLGEAAESYAAVLEVKPDHAKAHYNIGLVRQIQGQLTDAVASYRKALALEPNDAETHNGLGLALQDQGQLDDAIACYRQALTIDPYLAQAHYNLGIALKLKGMLDEAIASYRNALAVRPNYAKAHCNLGIALQNQGQFDEAVDSLRAALMIDENFANAQKALGMTFHYQGRIQEAKQAYEAGIALDSEPDIAGVGLRRVLIDLKELPAPACEAPGDWQKDKTLPRGLHIWNRPVEKALCETLYRLAVMSPEEEANAGSIKDNLSVGIRRGNMFFSADFRLLDHDIPVIRTLRGELLDSLSSLLGADIFVSDSFFNIYHAGSQAVRHRHIDSMDKALGLAMQKFSLVYYVDPGDTTGAEPGILKLFNPDYDLYPKEGDIALFPSATEHSASYDGASDRVILGLNFYTI